jgi:hypothetical protein
MATSGNSAMLKEVAYCLLTTSAGSPKPNAFKSTTQLMIFAAIKTL